MLTRWQRDDSKQHFNSKTSNYIMKLSEVCADGRFVWVDEGATSNKSLLLGSSTVYETVPSSGHSENHLGNFLKMQMASSLFGSSKSDSLSETHGDPNMQPGI